MSESPIELGPCEITITRSDGSREIIEAASAEVVLRSHSPECWNEMDEGSKT